MKMGPLRRPHLLTMQTRYLLPCLLLAAVTSAPAVVTLTALTSFGGGDGWLAPGDSATDFLNTGNNERGLAFNPVTGHLLMTSRSGGNSVRIMDSASGADLGGLTMTATVTGGTFPINQVRVGTDGAIYVASLASPVNPSVFKIYRWADESAASVPTVAFSTADSPVTLARLGDTLDIRGGGAGVVLIAGESTATGSSGAQNGYIVFTTADNGLTLNGTKIDFVTPPTMGDFNRGTTFMDSDTLVMGKGSLGATRRTSYTGSTGTLLGSQGVSGFMMDYAVVGGIPLLATLDISGGTGTNIVRVYDMTNPAAPVLDATANVTTSFTSSTGSVGSIFFGAITGNTATLYALNVANGIQAFTVTVPAADPPLLFTSSSLNPAGTLNLAWASAPGRTYRVEGSSDLTAWTPIVSGWPAGAGTTTSYSWTIPGAFTNRAQVRVVRE